MRERSKILQVILAALGVLITNAVIFSIRFYLALSSYNSRVFMPALSSALISITQLIYVSPTLIWLWRRQQFALEKGVVIGAIITVLLNGGCYLLFTLPW